MLRLELLVRQRGDQQEGPGSGLEELPGNSPGINPALSGDRGHESPHLGAGFSREIPFL
jgi:hypothetical protein